MASKLQWRDSARAPRFFIMDARAAFPLLFFLLHIQWWTFIVAIITTIFFAILERYGFSLSVFGRWLRTTIVGKRKVAAPWWQ